MSTGSLGCNFNLNKNFPRTTNDHSRGTNSELSFHRFLAPEAKLQQIMTIVRTQLDDLTRYAIHPPGDKRMKAAQLVVGNQHEDYQ